MACSAMQTSSASVRPSPPRQQRECISTLTPAIRSSFAKANARPSRGGVTRASSGSGEEVDFDKVLADLADKFEKSDNKAAIVGYSAAAVAGLWFSEWLIHLPLLNFLLGVPIQLLGLVLLPYFTVKYFVEGDNIGDDASKAFDKVVKKLPGFDSK